MIFYQPYNTPFGVLYIHQQGDYIIAVSTQKEHQAILKDTPLLKESIIQFDLYFSKKLKNFSLPMQQSGTAFQKSVWEILATIPYGQTYSYKEVATLLNKNNASRAVGNACEKNNLLILIPCHRVVGKHDLGGFALDLKIKQFLLDLEK